MLSHKAVLVALLLAQALILPVSDARRQVVKKAESPKNQASYPPGEGSDPGIIEKEASGDMADKSGLNAQEEPASSQDKKETPPRAPVKHEFRGPDLDQEERGSTLLPRHMRCDGVAPILDPSHHCHVQHPPLSHACDVGSLYD